MLGNNGIIGKAKEAKKVTEFANERTAIELLAMSTAMDTILGNSLETQLGTPLHDKTVNDANWNIIITKNNYKTYGTGWNYIEIGTDIPNYGNTQNEWIVNFKTGEVVALEKDNYQVLSKTLAITDGLIFNMDASNLDENASNFGENTNFYYYDSNIYDTVEKRLQAYNEQAKYDSVSDYAGYDRQKSTDLSNYTDTENVAFNFNGNNYIEVNNNGGFDFSQGLTFEFYGNINDGPNATISDEPFSGMLGLWSGEFNYQCTTRFGYLNECIRYSLGIKSSLYDIYGSLSNVNSPWNQDYIIDNFLNNDRYFTISLFPNEAEENITQKIYLNGKSLYAGWLSKEYYEDFLGSTGNLKYIELGRCTMQNKSNWCYTKGLCYATRIYNRGLSDEEVTKNYESTVTYREALLNSRN